MWQSTPTKIIAFVLTGLIPFLWFYLLKDGIDAIKLIKLVSISVMGLLFIYRVYIENTNTKNNCS